MHRGFGCGDAIEDEVCNVVVIFLSGKRRAHKLAEGIYFPTSKSLKTQDWLVLMMKQIGLLGLTVLNISASLLLW